MIERASRCRDYRRWCAAGRNVGTGHRDGDPIRCGTARRSRQDPLSALPALQRSVRRVCSDAHQVALPGRSDRCRSHRARSAPLSTTAVDRDVRVEGRRRGLVIGAWARLPTWGDGFRAGSLIMGGWVCDPTLRALTAAAMTTDTRQGELCPARSRVPVVDGTGHSHGRPPLQIMNTATADPVPLPGPEYPPAAP